MLRYTAARLLWLLPTLIAMSLITFVIMHATPGSPLDPQAPNANPLTPQAQENMARHYGLDKPLHEQFFKFLSNALHLDFGISYVLKDRQVSEIIGQTFPVSLVLGTFALIFAVTGGLLLGIVAATHQNTWIDYLAVTLAMICVSTPNFVIGVLLIVVLSIWLNLFPTAMSVAGSTDLTSLKYWVDNGQYWVLPTITLGVGPLATIARYTRASMLDVIRADFVRTARAKGLMQRAVILKHVMKNALIPVVTIIGPLFAAIGTGTFVVEFVFSVPGMGKFFVTSMSGRDYNMIMAVILLYGFFLALMNIVVDLVYGFLDPRIRYN